MITHARRLAPAVLPLALLLWLVGGDGGRAANDSPAASGEMVLLRIEPDDLTKYLHGVIQEELKAPAPDERRVVKVRAVALLIASQAQSGRGTRDVWQRAALRDNALRLRKALEENKLDAARRQAAKLFEVDSAPATFRPVDLSKLMELDEVELLMRQRRVGGLGFGPPVPAVPGNRDSIELRLMFLARKVPTAAEVAADAEHLARAATVTAAMANLLDAYAPDKKVGQRDPKDWRGWTQEMRRGSEDLEAAAKAKDAKALRAAAMRLTNSCNECHSTFRD